MNNINKLTPFKFFCLTNFPFIEEDFDALTYYELLCKVVEYLNKVIDTTNAIGTQTEDLTNAFNELKSYVDNYFTNLDVQEEINNKLDQMAESGELADLISQYLEIQAVIGFDTTSDLAQSTNLANGSITRTLGKNQYNDGYGAFYKIRNITSDDVIDNENIIKIQNNNTLIAEKMKDSQIIKLQEDVNQVLQKKYIFLGDSYGTGQNELGEQTNPWTNLVPQYLGLSQNQFITNSSNGSGFNHGKTFLAQLQEVANSIENKNEITDIVIIGGYNDRYHTVQEIKNAMSIFFKYAKSTFPFAKCKLACVGWSRVYDTRQSIANSSLNAYTQCGEYGCEYLKNTEFILHDYSLFSNDKYHPNQNGQNELSRYLADAIINGSCEIVRGFVTPTNAGTDNVIQYNPTYILQTQHNDKITLMANLGYITTQPVNIGNRTGVPLVKFTDGLILGSSLPLLRQYMQVFTADSGNKFIKLKGCFALQYSPSKDSCILYFINQADNETHNNISAFNTDIIYLELPALYC